MAKIEKFNRGFLLSRKGCELDAQISTIFVGKGCANFVQLFFCPVQKRTGKTKKGRERAGYREPQCKCAMIFLF